MKNNFPKSNKPIQLYRYEKSGHCHRVQLMLSLLEIPYEIIELERDGSNIPDWFSTISPLGQVPVIDDNGFKQNDSNAILVYLIKKYSADQSWLPEDPEKAAKTQRWLSVAAGELRSGPAMARFSKVFNVEIDYASIEKISIDLLAMLDQSLENSQFLTGNSINIADISLYTYIAHLPEGGIALDEYSNIIKWLSLIESQEGFIAMKSTSTS